MFVSSLTATGWHMNIMSCYISNRSGFYLLFNFLFHAKKYKKPGRKVFVFLIALFPLLLRVQFISKPKGRSFFMLFSV